MGAFFSAPAKQVFVRSLRSRFATQRIREILQRMSSSGMGDRGILGILRFALKCIKEQCRFEALAQDDRGRKFFNV